MTNHIYDDVRNVTFCGDYDGALAQAVSGSVALASCPDCIKEAQVAKLATTPVKSDPVSHPSHYTQYPVEVIEITERLGFLLGNVVKYVLRADYKGEPIQDLEKAAWYLNREIANRKKEQAS